MRAKPWASCAQGPPHPALRGQCTGARAAGPPGNRGAHGPIAGTFWAEWAGRGQDCTAVASAGRVTFRVFLCYFL